MTGRRAPLIMVVQDVPEICHLIEVSLQRCGFRVHSERHSEDARQWLQAAQPDLAVIDIAVPSGRKQGFWRRAKERHDGLVLARDLRTAYPATPVIITVQKTPDAEFRRENFRRIEESGCVPLEKPFDPMVLVGLVEKLLGVDDPSEPRWGSRI